MNTLVLAAKMVGVMGGGGIVGGIVAADVINDGTAVSLPMAVGSCAAVVAGAWWLSAKLVKLSDRIKALETAVNNLPCRGKTKCEHDED